ncbi:MAG: hypothetical protein L0Y54_24020, partial [Sporichthyaceae bacterium]|nr:hypothetical protein [Sporichthyaceae bacterium]
MSPGGRDRAVVLGGSIAGLLAARVLAEHYGGVTVVERDRLPAAAHHRRGVPHGRHFHGLLPHGQLVLEELLPGLSDGLLADGALTGDVLGNVRWYLRGQLLRQARIDLGVLSASRPLIEAAVRRRVLALPNVELRDGCSVSGLRLSPNRRRVTGVLIAGAPVAGALVSGGHGVART